MAVHPINRLLLSAPPFIRCIGTSHRGFLSLKFSSTLNVWDLAYMTELDPLWDDSVTTFFLNPDASLFANPAAAAACAADCVAATSSLPVSELYWCAGCHGGIFPLTGWVGSPVHFPQASSCRPLHDEAPSLRSSMGRLRRKRPMRPLSRTDHG